VLDPTICVLVVESVCVLGLKSILQNVRVVSFLFIILVLGFYNGVVMTYAFLYLRVTFQATQINIGLCVLVSVLVEFPVFFIGGWIVEKVIHHKMESKLFSHGILAVNSL